MACTLDEEATLKPFEAEGKQLLKKSRRELKTFLSVPTIVLYHVGKLDNKLALLVLLTHFKRSFLQKEQTEGITQLKKAISWFILRHKVVSYKNRDTKGDDVSLSKYKKMLFKLLVFKN